MHVGEYQVKKERDLLVRLEELHAQIAPMEMVFFFLFKNSLFSVSSPHLRS